MTVQDIINIACYRFVSIPEAELGPMREDLRDYTRSIGLKGTILLSTEGINLFISGPQKLIDSTHQKLGTYSYFHDLYFKESASDAPPFKRMLVKIKKEIISMGVPEIEPEKFTAPHLPPEELKKWYKEGREMIILDTRNDYEIALGTFDNAIDLNIKSFRDFPEALEQLDPEEIGDTPIVTFCTGGVRCEKAGLLMLNKGFKNVYQLDGGILDYFKSCGGDYYHGECFVFDKRVGVDSQLQETDTIQCFACRSPLDHEQQASSGGMCPHCQDSNVGEQINKYTLQKSPT